MKAGIYFTGSGPILLLTTFEALDDPKLVEMLASKGIKKFIAYATPVERVQAVYGPFFHTVMADVRQTDDLRVLDYNGHHVFHNFAFGELGEPVLHEPEAAPAAGG